jgi:hypothetical protein
MSRYIDADKLKSKVNLMSTHWLNEWDTLGVLAVIDSVQTADVEEIVRCKNCVFWKEHDGFGKCVKPRSNIKSDVWLNPLFYCRAGVKAERKTE